MTGPSVYRAEDRFADPAFPLEVHRSRQSPAMTPHTHDFVEIALVARGMALHRIEYDTETDGDTYRIYEGDAFVVVPGERHTYEDLDGLEIYNVLFQPSLLGDEAARLRAVEGVTGFLVLEPVFRRESDFRYKLHLSRTRKHEVERCLQAVMEEMAHARPGYQTIARGRFLECLVLLGRAFAAQVEDDGSSGLPGQHAAIDRAVAYIEENFADKVSLDDLARQAYLSSHYFCETFKAATGLSPMAYLTQTRLEEGKRRLRETDAGVTEIALAVGFCDASHFARVFKTAEGMSPTAYRKSGMSS